MMPARHFLRTREQHENAPVGTKVLCQSRDLVKTKQGWRAGRCGRFFSDVDMANTPLRHRHEVIRWGSGVVFEEVSRTLTKVSR